MSTFAPDTGLQPLLLFTTVIVSVRVAPVLPSRISLLIRLVSDGNGPMVSLGVVAQAEPDVPPVVAPVVPVLLVPLGAVAVPPHPNSRLAPAAPSSAIASRRAILRFMRGAPSVELRSDTRSSRRVWSKTAAAGGYG